MTIQKFVHKPEEITALRFYNNNKEVEEFLEDNNESCCMDYEWRFCVHNNEPLLEIREPLPECGVYKIIEIPRGDYISANESGVITHIYEDDITEFYDEVTDKGTRFITFNGHFASIKELLSKMNYEYCYRRYACRCYEHPYAMIEVSDTDRGKNIVLVGGDTLVIDKDGNLSK